jgi:streptomycin 6-kinase
MVCLISNISAYNGLSATWNAYFCLISNISAYNGLSATWNASLDNNGPHTVPAENTTSIPGVD